MYNWTIHQKNLPNPKKISYSHASEKAQGKSFFFLSLFARRTKRAHISSLDSRYSHIHNFFGGREVNWGSKFYGHKYTGSRYISCKPNEFIIKNQYWTLSILKIFNFQPNGFIWFSPRLRWEIFKDVDEKEIFFASNSPKCKWVSFAITV